MAESNEINNTIYDAVSNALENKINNCNTLLPSTTGKSTYDLAVDYGYIGTEREWLSSIANDTTVVSNLYADAQSFSDFMSKSSAVSVPRRLAPPIHTLNYYLDYFNGLEALYSQESGTVTVNGIENKTVRQAMSDAIDDVLLGEYQEGMRADLNAQKLDTGITATAKCGGIARTQAEKNSDTVSVKDMGAIGDGIADDTVSLQAAIDASYDIGVLNISSGNYKVTSMLEIKEPLKLFGSGATIFSDEDITILQITHSDVEVNGLEVVGNFVYPNYRKNGVLIYAKGESVPNNAPIEIENITIKDCRLRNGARSGVELLHVNGFNISGCDIKDCGYSGVASISGKNGLVENNTIEEIGSVQVNNYGIYFSQNNSHDVIANPVSVNCVARDNKIKNIAWEGLDCHGGNGIEFIGNYLQDCGQKNAAIMIAHSDGEDKEPISGAKNIKVKDNTIVVTAVGTYGHGIATSNAIESSNIQISGNLVVGCGKGTVNHAGILLGYVKDALVSDNVIKNIYGVGVYVSKRAKSTSIKNNSIIDVSSATVGNAIAVRVVRTEGDASDQVEVSGNSLLSGGLVASNLNEVGLYALGDVGKLSIGGNNFKIAENYQHYINASQFDRATAPVMNYGNIKMTFDGTKSTLSEVIVLDNEHSGNTMYECVASSYTASNPIKDFVFYCSKVNAKSIKITARTMDGSNFDSGNAIGFSFITVGC